MKIQSGFLFRAFNVLFLLGLICLVILVFLPVSLIRQETFEASKKKLSSLTETVSHDTVNGEFSLDPGYGIRVEKPFKTPYAYGNTAIFDQLEQSYPGNRALNGFFPTSLREFKRNGILVYTLRIGSTDGFALVQSAMDYRSFRKAFRKAETALISLGLLLVVLWGIAFLFFQTALGRFFHESGEALKKIGDGHFEISKASGYSGGFEILSGQIRRTASELSKRFAALSTEKERLQRMVRAFPLAALILDNRERVILANPRFELLSHTQLNEGRYYWELLRDRELDDMIARMKQVKSEFTSELRLKERIYRISLIPCPGEQLLVVFDDITERSNLEKIKRDFVANVSHELKTPLTAIRGFLETFSDLDLSPENRRQLGIVERNTVRMSRIVNDLLTLSAIEESAANPVLLPVNLKELAEGTFGLLESAAQKKGLLLHQEWEGSEWTIPGNREQLEQLFLNLIDNAVKYTDRGSVTLSGFSNGETATIRIRDTGIGIPREHLPRLFERFYVVDKSRSKNSGGTGLGLAIAKHAALFHGGEIRVESRPGYGTEFIVILPLGKKSEEKRTHELQPR